MKNLQVHQQQYINYGEYYIVCVCSEISSDPHTFDITAKIEAEDGGKSGAVM